MSTELDQSVGGRPNLQDATRDLKEAAQMTGAAALDVGRATCQELQDRAVRYGRAADNAVRGKPYLTMGLVFVAGLALGAFLSRPKRIDQD